MGEVPDAEPPHRSVVAGAADIAAALVVLAVLVAPTEVGRLSPTAFLVLPLEGLLGLALLLILPSKARRPVAGVLAATLGLLAVVKVIDVGFFAVLARSFDPLLDWVLLGDAVNFVRGSFGTVAAAGWVVAAVAVAAVLLGGPAAGALRLARLAARHRSGASGVLATGAVLWVGVALLGVQVLPGVPLATGSATGFVAGRTRQVAAGLQDRRAFAAEAAVDAFGDLPGDRLLTALRGKDVVIAFVESYGRDAVEDPEFAGPVGVVLHSGDRRLAAAGFASRSAFLTSPTFGGSSWLAHSTLLSGLWVDTEQRYRSLVTGNRLTLPQAFRRAGWRTVGAMPGTTAPWPEGAFFGYDRVYDFPNLGYRGPNFSWATMPDQYTLAAFERFERARGDRPPLMAEINLVSSHAPWSPTPRLIDWSEIKDGSVFFSMAAEGDPPSAILTRDPRRVRADYRQSVEYSLATLVSYVETFGDEDLVLVMLGDHQPSPIVTGDGASRDVPVSVIARDPAVLDRLAGWQWESGLMPGPRAPVWRMDTFRDRFLTAFGPDAATRGRPR